MRSNITIVFSVLAEMCKYLRANIVTALDLRRLFRCVPLLLPKTNGRSLISISAKDCLVSITVSGSLCPNVSGRKSDKSPAISDTIPNNINGNGL